MSTVEAQSRKASCGMRSITHVQCLRLFLCRASRLAEIKLAHKRYGEQHLKNSSTRGVLAAAFTAELADDYMKNVMFDSATHQI